MKKLLRIITFVTLCFALTLTGCGNENPSQKDNSGTTSNSGELIVSAAASLKESMDDIKEKYSEINPGIKLTFNFGGSGTLQQQIEQGAPADLFISAGKPQMDALIEKDLMVKDSVTSLLVNELVLVVGKDNTEIQTIDDLTSVNVVQIGIGTPESVPAGRYAQEALTYLELWEELQPKYVMAKDVNQVLNYVETGNTEAGIVYKSDAQNSDKAKIVTTFPAESHAPIIYPAGIVAATQNQQAAEEFLEFLQGSEAQEIFAQYGFRSVE
ncbi:MAG: molybdate ABC transporter substrate-binding protein [Desulfitobacterium sp.]|nr:molybdate ABC transporter substrate-binding protein [Desulfitobacterium sp.]